MRTIVEVGLHPGNEVRFYKSLNNAVFFENVRFAFVKL